jgi:translation elongation factor EF-1alpha
MPSDVKVEILALYDSCGSRVDSCKAGDVLKIHIRSSDERTKGLVICENHEKCVTAKEFRAEVTFHSLPSGQVNPGFNCEIQMHTSLEQVEISEILSVYDLETKAKQKIHQARDNQRANVILKLATPICAENSSRGWDMLSKFSLWSEGRVVGTGKVMELHNRVEEIASQMGLF